MYKTLNPELEKQMLHGKKYKDTSIRRNDIEKDRATFYRPEFLRDVEKIINCPYFNRYSDKTQVFSFNMNDDISRRALHVQLVSRIARNMGRLLNLNLDLIEAIALGHDLGHTPFGHAGEDILSKLYYERTGRYFLHNVQSVRVLDKIFNYNVSLQTLDGILCHNGECELMEYRPKKLTGFEQLDSAMEECSKNAELSHKQVPGTLEGCVVRIADIIAYLGKDRQDATITKTISGEEIFDAQILGKYNASIINNLVVNIVENSYGKDYIALDKEYFEDLKNSKKENFRFIYKNKSVTESLDGIVPIFEKIYEKCYNDLVSQDTTSPIYKHHINYIAEKSRHYIDNHYEQTEKNQIVVDYIASMTDSYAVEFYKHFFGDDTKTKYISYFKNY